MREGTNYILVSSNSISSHSPKVKEEEFISVYKLHTLQDTWMSSKSGIKAWSSRNVNLYTWKTHRWSMTSRWKIFNHRVSGKPDISMISMVKYLDLGQFPMWTWSPRAWTLEDVQECLMTENFHHEAIVDLITSRAWRRPKCSKIISHWWVSGVY